MVQAELRLLVPEWVHRHMCVRARMMSMGPRHVDVTPEDLASFYLAAGLYTKEQGPEGACQLPDPWWGIDAWPARFEMPSASIVAVEAADRLPEQFATLRKSLVSKIRILKSNIVHLESPDADAAYDAEFAAYQDDVPNREPERWRISLLDAAFFQLEQAEAALLSLEQTEIRLYDAKVLVEPTKAAE